ncbi:uncharacterized protein LOC126842403 isoform X3 [Adelges cooleyi]|uniref:uncharacterized protein LOC126842403 isoform X3 n=1 Tax=Adelges cooleyi TaxID=133065 RepID=UPI00217FDABE|nr:uncharacterized protein LOC126842403 isoform X3 [Adelges cooleyi]
MKLLCILITLAFVNVSPIMTSHYANSVYITNKYIKEAFDTNPAGLETAISNIINRDKSIVTVNLMWAIPETAKIFKIETHGDPFIINLPESIAIADQLAVQKAIYQATKITVPQLGENENFENDSLNTFGEQRRLITGKVTKNALIAAIAKGRPKFANFTEICRLMGLLRSIKFPDDYIRNVDVDHSGNCCTLTSLDGSFKYKRDAGYIFLCDDNFFEDIMYHIRSWYP